MVVETLLSIGTIHGPRVVIAFRHPPKIVLVQEFATVSFFAQPAEIMLAYQGMGEAGGVAAMVLVAGGKRDVFVGAGGAEGAVALLEGRAHGLGRGNAEAVLVEEEREEGEVVGGGRGGMLVLGGR